MSYLVLARKWRPQQFADMLGQEHVTRTLTNALRSGRVAHAFLFTGARGVGKTSAARILAKALCCENTGEVTAEPCGTCTACVEIAEGRATDVFEIDAASNTGVANVREIIENVRYLPSRMRFKIYIVDEVHMLSKGAFNALLKTLEEPPPHVKFILATTDVHQVPVTILSRCQRYDFRRIALAAVAERLSHILGEEGVDHDPASLFIVARESEGSMRDAQSLLEQVLSFAAGRRLDGDLVREALGVADRASVEGTLQAIFARDVGGVLAAVKEVHERGLDLKRFVDALVEEVRDLLVARVVPQPGPLLDRPKDELDALVARAKPLDPRSLERLFRQLADGVTLVAESPYPRFALEVHLASLAEEPPRLPVEALLDKLDGLERGLIRGDAQPSRAPSAAPGGAAGPRTFPGPRDLSPAPAPRSAEPGAESARPSAPAPRPGAEAPRPSAQVARPAAEVPRPSAQAPRPAAEAPRPAVEAPRPAAEVGWPATPRAPSGQATAPSPSASAPTPPGPEATATPPAAAPPPEFATWVAALRKRRPTLGGSLVQLRPVLFTPASVVLGVENAFDAAKLAEPEVRAFLLAELAAFFGRTTALEVTRLDRGEGAPLSLAAQEEAARVTRRQDKAADARSRTGVLNALSELGGRIARVKVVEDD